MEADWTAAPTCSYCGWLGWTVEKYGRVTHKQACPHRTDPWHQGDQTAATTDHGQGYPLRRSCPYCDFTTIRAYVTCPKCRPEQTEKGTVTCPECHAVYVVDEDATADERSYADG